MACNDPEIFFFEQLQGNSTYTLTLTGPAGQFTGTADFRDANTEMTTPLRVPPGMRKLDPAPGKAHIVTILLLIVAACEVTVEADCGGKKYCRRITGAPNDHPILTHVLRMV